MNVLPFQFRDQAEFDALRSKLTEADYQYETILTRRGMETFGDVEKRLIHGTPPPEPQDALDLLIFLFAEGGSARRIRIEQLLGEEFVSLLDRFKLLMDDPARPGFQSGSVAIGPVHRLFTISDRWWGPGGEKIKPPADAVYPGTAPNTVRFLELLPRTPCENYLDVCCGTAIAAMMAARDYAKHAYAFDLAERSTIFAEFGRRLNGIENLTIRTGDLYEPAAGMQFDYITAHPPYIPVSEPKFIFQDGGEDGEMIVRRVVQEAPGHLAPGGRLFMLSLTTDRKERPAEQRIREWLGDSRAEFDVALLVRRMIDPGEFASRALLRGTEDYEKANARRESFQRLGITAMPYALTVVQRHAAEREPFTIRRTCGPGTLRDEIDTQIRWERMCRDGSAIPAVLENPLTPQKEQELIVRQKLDNGGGWTEQQYVLRTPYPFQTEMDAQSWIVYLVGRCDGVRTGMDHMRHLIEEGIVEPDTPPAAFAQALMQLVSGGFLCPPALT